MLPRSVLIIGLEKKVFKRSMQKYLRLSILTRSKQGFRVPFKKWLDAGLQEYSREVILDSNSFCLHILGKKAVEKLFMPAFHRLDRIKKEAMIWRFLIFELWKKQILNERNERIVL